MRLSVQIYGRTYRRLITIKQICFFLQQCGYGQSGKIMVTRRTAHSLITWRRILHPITVTLISHMHLSRIPFPGRLRTEIIIWGYCRGTGQPCGSEMRSFQSGGETRGSIKHSKSSSQPQISGGIPVIPLKMQSIQSIGQGRMRLPGIIVNQCGWIRENWNIWKRGVL